MEVKLGDVKANPFRGDIPLEDERLARLKASIGETGFWDGLKYRVAGDEVQIAFGHHRIEAARNVLGDDYLIDVEDGGLTDTDMVRMLVSENSEEYSHCFLTGTIMAIQAVLRAYGGGKVEFPAIDPSTKREYIRRATPGGSTYTATTLAQFLGWTKEAGGAQDRVHVALRALDLEGFDLETLRGLGRKSVEAAVRLATVVGKRTEEESRIDIIEAQTDLKSESEAVRIAAQKTIDEAEKAAKTAAAHTARKAVEEMKEGATTIRSTIEAAAPKTPRTDTQTTDAFLKMVESIFRVDSGSWGAAIKRAKSDPAYRKTLAAELGRAAERANNRKEEL